MNTSNLNIEGAVAQRYSQASQAAETALCCPVDYDAQWLQVLPQDLIDRDYGCGDPSKWVQEGDHVLDLGSGCLLYTSPSPRDLSTSRMPSSA